MAGETARQLIEGLPQAFTAERVWRVSAVIQFELSGGGKQPW